MKESPFDRLKQSIPYVFEQDVPLFLDIVSTTFRMYASSARAVMRTRELSFNMSAKKRSHLHGSHGTDMPQAHCSHRHPDPLRLALRLSLDAVD